MKTTRILIALVLLTGGTILNLRAQSLAFSAWTYDLSLGGTNNDPYDAECEIAVSDSVVHVLWIGEAGSATLYYRRSPDGGQTWGAITVLAQKVRQDTVGQHLAVVSNHVHVAYEIEGNVYYRRSQDGGTTFADQKLIRSAAWPRIAADQNQVAIAMEVNLSGWQQVLLSRSLDQGGLFQEFVIAQDTNQWGMMTVGHTYHSGDLVARGSETHLLLHSNTGFEFRDSELLYGRVDTSGAHGLQILSIPREGTWEHSADIHDENYSPNIAASDDGHVYVVWRGFRDDTYGSFFLRSSADHGASFSQPLDLTGPTHYQELGSASCTVAAKEGYVYVSYLKGGKLVLRRSLDYGASFLPEQTLLNGGRWPLLAVDPSDPTGASVYSLYLSPGYQKSTDGGAHFTGGVDLSLAYTMGVRRNYQVCVDDQGYPHTVTSTTIENPPNYDIFYRRLSPALPRSSTNQALRLGMDPTANRYDNLQIPLDTNLDFATAFSVEAWVNPAPGCAETMQLVAKQNGTSDVANPTGYQLGFNSYFGRRPNAGILTTSGKIVLWGGRLIPDDQWTHLAMTYDAAGETNNFKLYINGQLDAATTTTGSLVSGGNILVGGFKGGEHYYGAIDDLRFWNRALTEAEVRSGLGSPLQGNEAGLVSYYPFDGTQADATGHGHDGVFMYLESFVPGFSKLPAFSTATMADGVAQRPFVWQVKAEYATLLMASGLPQGLSLDGMTGLITGTPTQAGVFVASVIASNFTGVVNQDLRFLISDPSGILFRDDFNNGLNAEWTVVPSDTTYNSFYPGGIRARANFGETWGSYNRPINLFAIDSPTPGDWTATLGVSSYLPAQIDWNRIAVVAWDDTDNVVSLMYGYSGGYYIGAYAETAQQMTGEGETRSLGSGPYLLRLQKEGNQYCALWSTNGIDFQQGGKAVSYGSSRPAKIGFWFGTDQTQTNIALIDFFEVAKVTVPPPRLSASAAAGKFGFTWMAVSNATYSVEMSSDFAKWVTLGSPLTGQSGSASFAVPMTNARAFYRLRIQ